PDSSAAQKAIVAAMGDGTLEKDDLVEKSERVVAMQLATADAQKAVQSDGESGHSTDSDADQQKVLTEVAETSLTVLKGECSFAGTDAISIVGGAAEEQADPRHAAGDDGAEDGAAG